MHRDLTTLFAVYVFRFHVPARAEIEKCTVTATDPCGATIAEMNVVIVIAISTKMITEIVIGEMKMGMVETDTTAVEAGVEVEGLEAAASIPRY